jgi:hypothetical protein
METTMKKIQIDFNNRGEHGLIRAGFEDVIGGETPSEGDLVHVIDPDEGLEGTAPVVRVDADARLLYLAVVIDHLQQDEPPLLRTSPRSSTVLAGNAFAHGRAAIAVPDRSGSLVS